jgi:predicted kinase
MQVEARKFLKEGKTVIIDATNTNPKARGRFTSIARELGVSIEAYMVDVPISVAYARNKTRERQVPEFAIAQQYKALSAPDNKEVDTLYKINEKGETTKAF